MNCKNCKYYYINRGERLEDSAYCDDPNWSYLSARFGPDRVMIGCSHGVQK